MSKKHKWNNTEREREILSDRPEPVLICPSQMLHNWPEIKLRAPCDRLAPYNVTVRISHQKMPFKILQPASDCHILYVKIMHPSPLGLYTMSLGEQFPNSGRIVAH